MDALRNLDKDHWAQEWSKIGLGYEAKGDAASVREALLAEAEGKMKLQEALKMFDDSAIRALTAEKMIEMNLAIGVEVAKALATAKEDRGHRAV